MNTPKPNWSSRAVPVLVPHRRVEVTVETVDGDSIATDPSNGGVYHLNQTALMIWTRCDGKTTNRQIAAQLATDYEVDFDTALSDVDQVVSLLADNGLIGTPENSHD
jgi:hypothetical protein